MADIYQYIDNNPVQRNTPGIVARVEALEECGCGAITMDEVKILQEPDALPIGQPQTFRFQAAPAGLDYTTVDGIVVKVKTDVFETQEFFVELEEGQLTADWTYTAHSNATEETEYELTIYAIDSLGNKSKPVVLHKLASNPFIRAPRITSPAANSFVYPAAGFSASTSAFSVFVAEDTHISTDWLICEDAEGTTPVVSVLASSDLLSHEFVASELTGLQTNKTYYLFARHNGEALGAGKLSAGVALRSRPAGVKAPEIITPSAGSKIAFTAGVQITGGEFQTVGAEDTHASSDYKLTRDAAGQDIICQVTASSDLTSHTFPASEIGELDEGATYYAWVRYNGTTLGNGIWASVAWEAMLALYSDDGEIFIYRHANGAGSVLEFNFNGYKYSLFVIDARYRTKKKWGTYSSGIDSEFRPSGVPQSKSYVGDYSTKETVETKTNLNYLKLDSAMPKEVIEIDSERFTTEWLTVHSGRVDSQGTEGVPAVEYCRSLTNLFSGGLDVPSPIHMWVCYMYGDLIDALDPTAESYPAYKLGFNHIVGKRWYFDGAMNAFMCNAVLSGIYVASVIKNTGLFTSAPKNDEGGVLPIKLLSKERVEYLLDDGRKIYRHPTNIGSVIEFKRFNERITRLFVADASYRFSHPMTPDESDVAGLENFNVPSFYPSGGSTPYRDDTPVISDEQLSENTSFMMFKNDKTARENTTIWDRLSYRDYCPRRVRSYTDFDGGFDIPTVDELYIIWLLSDKIDELDPTSGTYRKKALGKYNNGTFGRFNFDDSDLGTCISSTENNGYGRIYCVNIDGQISNASKTRKAGCILVRELDENLSPIA